MVMVAMVVMVVMRFLHHNVELHGADVRTHDSRRTELITFDRQLSEFRSQVVEVQSKIQ